MLNIHGEEAALVLQDLEASLKQSEARCSELREACAGHEQRAREAAAEVTKSSHVIERLTADLQTSKDKLKRKQVIIVRQVRMLPSCGTGWPCCLYLQFNALKV